MRIALLTRRFDPVGGGTERDLMVTAECLREAGHEVTVYAGEVRAPWKHGAVRQVRVPRFSRALSVLRFAYLAPALARREGADLTLGFARVVGADVLRSGGGAHISYLRAARRWRNRLGASSMWASPYHCVQMSVERRGFRHPTLRSAIAVSDFVRRDLEQQFQLKAGKVITIYNGVDLERFTPLIDTAIRSQIRQRLGLSASTPVVIFVGNGFGRKGLASMLKAWPALKTTPRLLVVGNDRAAASFERLAARLRIGDRVSFLGAQPRIEDLLHATDVLALPSFFEPFGNVVMEAMACGLPALTSTCSGVAELMPAELRKFIVNDPSDPSEISACLDALIEARFDVAKVARPAAERFTWKAYAERLLQLLNRIARESSPRPN